MITTRKKILFLFFICLSFLLSLFLIWKLNTEIIQSKKWSDFDLYYTAAHIVENKGNPYDWQNAIKIAKDLKVSGSGIVFDNLMNSYLASPDFILLFSPIDRLLYFPARITWLILNDIFLLAGLFFIVNSFNFSKNKKWLFFAIGLLTFSLSYTISGGLGVGSNSLLLFLLFALVYFFIKRKKQYLAGISAALSVIVKPIGIVLFFIFLLRKNYRSFFAGLFFLAMSSLIVTVIFYPSDLHFHYLKNIFLGFNTPVLVDLSWSSFLLRFSGYAPLFLGYPILRIFYFFSMFIFLFYGFYILFQKRKTKSPSFDFEFSLIIILMLLGLSLVHEHYFLILIIPFFYSFNIILEKRRFWLIPLLLFSYLAIFFLNKEGVIYFNTILNLLVSGISVFGLIILLFILIQTIHPTSRINLYFIFIFSPLIISSLIIYSVSYYNYRLIQNKTLKVQSAKALLENYYFSRNAQFYSQYRFIHPLDYNSLVEARYKFDVPPQTKFLKIMPETYIVSNGKNKSYLKVFISQDDRYFNLVYIGRLMPKRETITPAILMNRFDTSLPLFIKVEMYTDRENSPATTAVRLQKLNIDYYSYNQ